MGDFFGQILFSAGETPISLGQVLLALLVIFGALTLMVRYRVLNIAGILRQKGISKNEISRFFRRYIPFVALLMLLIVTRLLNLHWVMFKMNGYDVTLRFVLEALTILLLASVLDWVISNLFIQNYFSKRDLHRLPKTGEEQGTSDRNATRLVQYIVYMYGAIILLKKFGFDHVLFSRDIKGEIFVITITDILVAILIILIARLVVWFLTQISLYGIYRNKNIDEGSQYAINQLVAYVVYTIAILYAMDQLVSDMKLIYGGAAALLVGIGLGLQQTFNDFFSGLVLLFERTVMVGDVIEMGDRVGKVKKIGLRASLIETRKNVSLLVPNSKLTNDFVVNWTHYSDVVRFEVNVSVAYGSDTRLVEQLLLMSVGNNDRVLKKPVPFVRFQDFGGSGLQFTLFYFSDFLMNADDVRSDIRFEIDRLFRESDIVVPFPQRDVWIRK